MFNKISIVIINYNNAHNLRKCIESLITQKYSSDLDIEIIFVDAGSSDASISIAEKFEKNNLIKAFYNKNKNLLSPSIARNFGAKYSKGEILIFTDSDCIVPNNWIQKIINNFKIDTNISCLFSGKQPDIGNGIGTFYRRIYTILYSRKFRVKEKITLNEKTINKTTPLILMATNNLSIKKEVWFEIGGMNENFNNPAGEDIMLELDIIRKGHTILYDPNNKVIHNHSIGFMNLIKKAWYQGESIYLLKKYIGKYLTWKHMLELKHFFKNIVFVSLILCVIFFTNIDISIKIPLIIFFFFLLIVKRTSELKTRFNLILEFQEQKYTQSGKISHFKLILFDIIDFITKAVRILSYTYYSLYKIKK